MYRTHYADAVNLSAIGRKVEVAGWVHRRRDHGGIIFLDVRDRTGLVQVVVEPADETLFQRADALRAEYVVAVAGEVRRRPEGMNNPDLPSGEVEIVPTRLEILAESQPLPFGISDSNSVEEYLRLQYRYLDLRRPSLIRNFFLRDEVLSAIRHFFHHHGFLDVETPALARSTPEGARDFLVPSRTQPGNFYALPQSPQIFKQLLMVAGFDRYYQIAKVFRDEDLRADRQPEFTQVDVEMAFASQDDVLNLMEQMLHEVFAETLATELPPFPRLSWQQAMEQYGSDKPDLRAGEPLADLSSVARGLSWPILADAEAVAGVVIRQFRPSRKVLDGLVESAKTLGSRGLIWLVKANDEIRSNAKPLGEEGNRRLTEASKLEDGDALLVVAGSKWEILQVAGQLRLNVARDLGRVEDGWRFCWVTDFPLFEWSAEEERLVSAHHPFTMPRMADWDTLEDDPLSARSQAYDVVLNGVELASGSVRIHRPEWQERIFRILGMSEEEIQVKFGFLVNAFQYGAPPHAGIAFGFDRLIMLMAGAKNLREVIAFPKTARGTDPLMQSPSPVETSQLSTLNLKLVSP